ncbi:MAG: Plastocyanin [Candidatus Doudnabacteria bacterium]|nr:Plastocyanin [Candidatus Doudnabacteria bacterium]
MKSKIIVAIALVALVAAGCNKTASQTTSDNSSSSQDNTAANMNPSMDMSTAANTPVANTNTSSNTTPPAGTHFSDGSEVDVPPMGKTVNISITSSGFSPASVTINQGDFVKFTNTDTAPHWPASDPHPTHTGYPGFDALKNLAKGETYTFQFLKSGSWGFHDHLHPTDHGTVIVK